MTNRAFTRRDEVERFARLSPSMFKKDMAIFQPLPRDGLDRLRGMELITTHGEDTLKIVSTYRLGADDLGFFLALISFGGQHSSAKLLHPAEIPEHRNQVTKHLEAIGDAVDQPHIRIQQNMAEILKAAGLPVKKNIWDQGLQKLERLACVKCFVYGPDGNEMKAKSGENLLAYEWGKQSGDLKIWVSDRLTQAILGQHFITVSVPTYVSLRGEVAKILFVRLCAAIREGETCKRTVEALTHLVYSAPPKDKPWTDAITKHRRHLVKTALKNIADVVPGWSVEVDDKDRFCITRPDPKKRRQPRKRAVNQPHQAVDL